MAATPFTCDQLLVHLFQFVKVVEEMSWALNLEVLLQAFCITRNFLQLERVCKAASYLPTLPDSLKLTFIPQIPVFHLEFQAFQFSIEKFKSISIVIKSLLANLVVLTEDLLKFFNFFLIFCGKG